MNSRAAWRRLRIIVAEGDARPTLIGLAVMAVAWGVYLAAPPAEYTVAHRAVDRVLPAWLMAVVSGGVAAWSVAGLVVLPGRPEWYTLPALAFWLMLMLMLLWIVPWSIATFYSGVCVGGALWVHVRLALDKPRL